MTRAARKSRTIPKRIVGEVSKNWPEVEPGLLSQRFEEVIRVNAERGYALESWQMARTVEPLINEPGRHGTNETIVAVFRELPAAPRRGAKGGKK